MGKAPSNKNNLSIPSENKRIDVLYERVVSHIDRARFLVQNTIDTEMIKAYWLIGQDIVEEEQHGEERAKYGKAILKRRSIKLQKKYKNGFSVDLLEKARKFFLIYQAEGITQKSVTVSRKSQPPKFVLHLSWSHYVELIKVSRPEVRKFYALEASKNNWNVRELRRQISSFLFDRLAKSKDKHKLMQLAIKGQEVNSAEDAIKESLVLEFLGAPAPHKLSESKLETALINNLQQFLLELGKGFAFIARQKRLTFDNDHYYADLILYHVILKCYVIIELKTTKLHHGDLGQIQFYVNYFDQEIKMDNDNPAIGLILCAEKSDAMVKYTLGNKAKQIFASKYQFHLPTEKELEEELKREIKEITHQLSDASKQSPGE